jgi:hypothetical protein
MNGVNEQVPASVIRARIDWVVESMSRDEIIEFFESLPPDVRRRVSRPQPSVPCDASMLAEVDRVIATLFGKEWN